MKIKEKSRGQNIQRPELSEEQVQEITAFNGMVVSRLAQVFRSGKAETGIRVSAAIVERIGRATEVELANLASLRVPVASFLPSLISEIEYAGRLPGDQSSVSTSRLPLTPDLICHGLFMFAKLARETPLAPIFLRLPADTLRELRAIPYSTFYRVAPHVTAVLNIPEESLDDAMSADATLRLCAAARMTALRADLM